MVARMLRMKGLTYDRQRDRYGYNRQLPSAIWPIVRSAMHDLITEDGRYIREKFPASHSEKQADDRWAEINVVFNTIVNAARRCLATPE